MIISSNFFRDHPTDTNNREDLWGLADGDGQDATDARMDHRLRGDRLKAHAGRASGKRHKRSVEELRKMTSKFLLQALTLTVLIVFSTIVSGEDSSITLPLENGETYHSILPISGETANPYRLVVIGDSVAWGNGLNQEHKYYNRVAKWLRTNLEKPVEIIVYAHSGAVISGASGESVKDANLNSGYPSLMDQAKNVPNNVDLILVSGGINDVGIANILDPKTSEDTIRSHSKDIK